MMPRAAANLFNEIHADSSHTYNVVMSYVQIYMELIQVCTSSQSIKFLQALRWLFNILSWLTIAVPSLRDK